MALKFTHKLLGVLAGMAIILPLFSMQNEKILDSVSTSAVTTEEKLFGDVNGDGSVDSIDASLILELYSNVSTGGLPVYCNNNGDRYIKLPADYWASEVAEMQKMSLSELILLNPQIEGINKIKANEKIYIYRSETTTTTTTTTKVTTTTAKPSTPTATAIKPTSSTKTATVVTATVTVKPTTSNTTTVITTTQPITTTVTTTKYPDSTLVTEPYFNSDTLYELNSPTATSWALYTNSYDATIADIKKASNYLNEEDKFQLYYTEIENVYFIEKNNDYYFLRISPESQNNFRVVGTLDNKFIDGNTYEILNITPNFFTIDWEYITTAYPGEKIKIISYIEEPKEYIWTPDRYHCIYNGNEYILNVYPQNLKYFKLCE